MSWADRPFAELVRMSWPITLSTLSYSMMTLVDTLLIGRIGPAELAGVGLGGLAAFVLLCFSFGLLRGVKTLVAQAIGANRPEEVGAYRGAAMTLALAIGALTVLLGLGLARFLPHLAATAAAGHAARTYLSLRILGAPAALLYVAMREVRYGTADARSPMTATVAANIANIVLAYLFVFVWHKGVAGAAEATIIAHTVEAGVLALRQNEDGWGVGRMRARHLRELWKIGFPTGLQFTLEVGSFAMLSALISALSEVQMAAHQVAIQVIHFSFLPAFAVAEAASVLAGQAVGANRDDLVRKVSRHGMAVAAAYTGACTVVLALGAPVIVHGFTSNAELAAAAIRLLHVAAIFQVFDGANIMARSILRGAGDVRYPAVVGVVTSWALTPPLTWILGYRAHLGAFGGWIGLCLEIVAGACLLWWRLERGTWRKSAAEARARLQAARASGPAGSSEAPETDDAPLALVS